MSKKTWIFPIAGKGERTSSYGPFKPFIMINEIRIIEWCLISMGQHITIDDELIFITTNDFEKMFRVSMVLETVLNKLNLSCNLRIVKAVSTPPGPAASVYLAREQISNSSTCVVVNSDQFINFQSFSLNEKEAALPIYIDLSNSKSYVDIKNNQIVKIVEKRNLSYLASAGVYGVASGADLIKALEMQFKKGSPVNGEFYVGPALNFLKSLGYKLLAIPCQAKFDLGCLHGIDNFKRFVNTMRISLDADNGCGS